jgi:YVTN family beta-propeller protein
MNKTKTFLCFALILGSASSGFTQAKTSDYKPVAKIKVEGDGGWDYITSDDETGYVYISHSTIVQVLDTKTGTVKATIPDTKGVHGIALAKDLNKGFISNGKDTSVTVFDLKTFATITKVKVTGKNPDAILYDSFSKKVFAYNGRTSNATVIDAKTNAVVATIPLEGKPEFSVADGKGKVFVNIEDKHKVCMINSSTLKVEQTWAIAPGEEPSGLAIDIKNHRLFLVCGNNLMIIMNSETGKVISNFPIGDGSDGIAFDPSNERAYSSNGDGTITVVQGKNGGEYKILETIPTQKGARTIAVDTKTHHLYLPTAEFEPAPAGEGNEKKRPSMKKGSFCILDVAPAK